MRDRREWWARVAGCFEPRERPPLGDWLEANVRLPEGPMWDARSYPHLHAPGGPIDAFQRPEVRTIWLQWGTRLGKTAFGHGCLLYQAANDPCSMLFGSATESLIHRSVREKLYPMIERCGPLKGQLPHPSKRSSRLVRLKHCRIFCAWSGSSSQLADISARVTHANEIDKWSGEVGNEADPIKLFDERSKEFPTHKRIKEGTPTIRGKSRIEHGMAGSTAARYWVPCPHCGTFQVLDFGGKDAVGGVKWPKEIRDPLGAKRAAYYQCSACGEAIRDHHRYPMMRAGVWAPDGCKVVEGQVEGSPLRSGEEWGFHLPSLYSLQLGWGDVAAEFLRSKDRPHDLRNFVNSWQAETWEEVKQVMEEATLGNRLSETRRMGAVPDEAIFLTAGCDVQGDHLVYVVTAWGLQARGWVVRYGTVSTFDDLWNDVLSLSYRSADGTFDYYIPYTLIDSGFRQPEAIRFCLEHDSSWRFVRPCKGATGLERPIDPRPHEIYPGVMQTLVNTTYWQDVLQTALSRGSPGSPYSIAFPAEARQDFDFLKQLLNETPVERPDNKGYLQRLWIKRHESQPNDFRDCLRYARVAAELNVGEHWERLYPEDRKRSAKSVEAIVIPPVLRAPSAPLESKFNFTPPSGGSFIARRN